MAGQSFEEVALAGYVSFIFHDLDASTHTLKAAKIKDYFSRSEQGQWPVFLFPKQLHTASPTFFQVFIKLAIHFFD